MNRLQSALMVALLHVPAVSAGLTATSTPTPAPFCTPPLCAPGSVFHCPGECPGGCGVVCATPTPNCFPPSDQIRFEFSADPVRPKLGASVRIAVAATNTSDRIAGLPQLTLQGASSFFDRDPPPVTRSGPLGTIEASFDLIAQHVGIAELTAFITYETQLGCPPDLFFGFWQATSQPFQVIIEGDGGPTSSPTPTPTQRPFCTPVSCPMGQVPYCPDSFLCECATACATPTPTAACTPIVCGADAVPVCADGTTTCCGARCATRTPTPISGGGECTGDCDHDGRVDVGEIIRGVRVALGLDFGCSDGFDRNLDGDITVDELVLAVNAALIGCPSVPLQPSVLLGTYDGDFLLVTPGGETRYAGIGLVPVDQGAELQLLLQLGLSDAVQVQGPIANDGTVSLYGYRNDTDVSYVVHGQARVVHDSNGIDIGGRLEDAFGGSFRIDFALHRAGEVPDRYSAPTPFTFVHYRPDCVECVSFAEVTLDIPPTGQGTSAQAEVLMDQNVIGTIEPGIALVTPGGRVSISATYRVPGEMFPSQIRVFGNLNAPAPDGGNGVFEIGYHPGPLEHGTWRLDPPLLPD